MFKVNFIYHALNHKSLRLVDCNLVPFEKQIKKLFHYENVFVMKATMLLLIFKLVFVICEEAPLLDVHVVQLCTGIGISGMRGTAVICEDYI